jgi:multidrug resistance protein, MATE family
MVDSVLLGQHVSGLLRLALPVMLARAGLMLMVTVDTIVVGRFGAQDLAFLGLAGSVQGTLMATMVGILLGSAVMTAQALGAGRNADVGRVFRFSIPYAGLIGLVGLLVCLFGEPLFRLLGQQPDLAAGAGQAMAAYAWGMPAAALFISASFFLEALKRPQAGMAAVILGNIANLALVVVLVFGHFGLPALGATGAAWATTIVRWGMALGLVGYIIWHPAIQTYGVRTRSSAGLGNFWRMARDQRRVGYAAGLSNGMEASAFSGLSIFAGWLGPLALGAYTVGLNLIALPFMAALGMASATAVRVGTAYGARDRVGVILAGWTGLGVTALLLGCVGLAFALFPGMIAAGFSRDPALIAIAAPVVAFSAWILVVDGGQVVMAQALRGRNDRWVPTVLHFFSYFAIMLPLCWLLAFPADRGVMGLFEGIFIASLVSVTILSLRFASLAGRRLPP